MKYDPRAPRPHARRPRPHLWLTGPDPVRHKMYLTWLQQRNQALFRQEGWSIDFEAWAELWQERWHQRGRRRGDYCMTRVDWELPWTLDNVAIVTRSEHARAQGAARKAGWVSASHQNRKAQNATTTKT